MLHQHKYLQRKKTVRMLIPYFSDAVTSKTTRHFKKNKKNSHPHQIQFNQNASTNVNTTLIRLYSPPLPDAISI